jgi:A/G-specific adenine glycosylase
VRRRVTSLLEWYGPRQRAYPWRTTPRDPYRILVSEVMLQQTQAARVVPHYRAFITRFPSVESLAAARRAEVVAAWAGLGYNRRAVALSEAARTIVRRHGGGVPSDPEVLVSLPGVGPYTAAAVASIAFGLPVAAIDVNVARVVARARIGRDPGDVAASTLRGAATRWMAGEDAGAWNQAVMDLGRAVCRPNPRCEECPIRTECRYRRRPKRSPHRSPPFRSPGSERFDGSRRQLRGRVVAALLRGPISVGRLAVLTGWPLGDIGEAIRSLETDGLVRAGPAARAGRPQGRVRLSP